MQSALSLAALLTTVVFSQLAYAQNRSAPLVAPVTPPPPGPIAQPVQPAPPAPAARPTQAPNQTANSAATQSKLPSEVDRTAGMRLYKAKEYSLACERFEQYIYDQLLSSNRNELRASQAWVEVLMAYAECCFKLEQYRKAITAYDYLERMNTGDAATATMRGICYQSLEQWIPAIDNYRLAFVRQPKVGIHSTLLARALLTAPHASLRDAKEAANVLEGVLRETPKNTMILELEAMIASESRDFDKAVQLQSEAVALAKDENEKTKSSALLGLFRREIRYPYFNDAPEELDELKLTQAVSAGTVFVRVRGRAAYLIDDRSGSAPRVIEHQHAGVVLDDSGNFLISTASLSIPYTSDPTWKSTDEARWLEGPFIEVYASTPSPEGVVSLGRAEVRGQDQATGLALIRLIEPLDAKKRRMLSPLPFQPIYRTEQVKPESKMTALSLHTWSSRQPEDHAAILSQTAPFSEIRFRPEVQSVEVNTNHLVRTKNRWHEPQSKRVCVCNDLTARQLTVGAPVVDAAGECVSMVDEVMTDHGLVKVGIPAETLSRVAARLLSFGQVRRAGVPFSVSAVELEQYSGKDVSADKKPLRSLRGMEIYDVLGRTKAERELAGLVITHVNDEATPYDSAWEAALEKAARLKQKSLICTTFNYMKNVTKTIEIPVEAISKQ